MRLLLYERRHALMRINRLHLGWWVFPLLFVLLITACSFSPAPPQPIYYYTLDYDIAPLADGPVLPAVIRIDRFSASPPFDSQRIIYADQGLHRNAYAFHHWISPPGELMAYMVARDLRRTNRFQAVLTPDSLLRATHIVNGWVEEFLEEDAAESWQASICLHITLLSAESRDPSEKIFYQKTYRARAVSQAKTPSALAQAMSTAAADISGRLIEDLYATLTSGAPDS